VPPSRSCNVRRSPYVDDMSTEAVAKYPSRVEAIASTLLGPIPVASTLYLIAGLGSLAGQTWAHALFWSLTILVAGVTIAVLAGARPLPRLADQSHLISRLSWLGRYGTAAFLLCISTYLGGMAVQPLLRAQCNRSSTPCPRSWELWESTRSRLR
jgi:hypothetical protein